jgi:hypothetical protein
MFVNGAVPINMSNDVAPRVPVQRVVEVAVRAGCGLRDESRLKGKRYRCRRHHDVDRPPEKRPRTGAQRTHVPIFSALSKRILGKLRPSRR